MFPVLTQKIIDMSLCDLEFCARDEMDFDFKFGESRDVVSQKDQILSEVDLVEVVAGFSTPWTFPDISGDGPFRRIITVPAMGE